MSYSMNLDEFSNESIETEYLRRMDCMASGRCYYCTKPLDNRIACKLHPHDGSSQE